MSTPFLSVITPTYNRAELLATFLESICTQDLPSESYEVIVADNNSTDGTREVISRYAEKYAFVSSIVEVQQGTSSAKNTAVRRARAPYLAFFDDDVIVPPNHLSNAVKIIQQYSPDIIGGPIFPYFTVKKPWWFRDAYETKRFEDQSGFSQKCRVTGANWIIRHDLLLSLGGFDPRLGPIGMDARGAYIVELTGDERKLLDTYRARTILSAQKVFYALECPVQHCVAPYKLRLAHHLGRAYTAGKTMALLRNDVWNAPWSKSDVLSVSKTLVPKLLQRLGGQVREHGWRTADYIEPFTLASFDFGYLAEGMRHVGSRERTRIISVLRRRKGA